MEQAFKYQQKNFARVYDCTKKRRVLLHSSSGPTLEPCADDIISAAAQRPNFFFRRRRLELKIGAGVRRRDSQEWFNVYINVIEPKIVLRASKQIPMSITVVVKWFFSGLRVTVGYGLWCYI